MWVADIRGMMSKTFSKSLAFVVFMLFCATTFLSPSAWAGDQDGSRAPPASEQRGDASKPPAATPADRGKDADASRYAARELNAIQQGDFQGGGILIIGLSTGAVILLVVLLVILV